jgi:Protein of unknown function (DUF 659)
LAIFDKISPYKHSKLDKLAALMIYDVGLPLTFFERPAVKAFLHRLRPAYNLLSRVRLSTELLKNSYQSVRQEIKEYLDKQNNLYISFDESNDIASNRIINIAIITDRDAFYNQNIDIGAVKATAKFYIEKIK